MTASRQLCPYDPRQGHGPILLEALRSYTRLSRGRRSSDRRTCSSSTRPARRGIVFTLARSGDHRRPGACFDHVLLTTNTNGSSVHALGVAPCPYTTRRAEGGYHLPYSQQGVEGSVGPADARLILICSPTHPKPDGPILRRDRDASPSDHAVAAGSTSSADESNREFRVNDGAKHRSVPHAAGIHSRQSSS